MAAAGELELGEEVSDEGGDLVGTEVDGALAAVTAVGEAIVGAKTFSAAGSPGGDDGALGGEEAGVGEDEGAGAGGAGFFAAGRLVNRVAFFRGGGLLVGSAAGWGSGAGRLVNRIVFFHDWGP